jgi:hypothetical protein
MEPGGSSTTTAPSTCAEYAKGVAAGSQREGLSFLAPVVQTTGSPAVYLRVAISFGYFGPGTYTSGATPGVAGTASVADDDFALYHSTNASMMTVTVRPDGSGTLSFSRWRADEVRGGIIAGHLGGTVSWVCR